MIRIQPKDPKGIKIRLKQLRLEKGWSKTETAKRIGVPISTYSNWEYGVRVPNQLNASEAAKVFNTTLTYIFDGGIRDKRDSATIRKSNNLDNKVINLNDILHGAKISYDGINSISKSDNTLIKNFVASILSHYE